MPSSAPRARGFTASVTLFFLAPLIAEYLLGDLRATDPAPLVALAPLYGGGALLLRHAVRSTGGGLRMAVCLALAYGLAEEGLVTQSLFNPDFLGLKLLDYGFLPGLGTAAPWAIDVLTVHLLWSLLVPIGITESLFVGARQQPWFGWIGLGVSALLCAGGAALAAAFALKRAAHFASPAQLGVTAAIVALLIAAAFTGPRTGRAPATGAPPPWPLTLLVTTVAGSLFLAAYILSRAVLHWPWQAAAAAMLALDLSLLAYFAWATRRRWRPMDGWAAAMGGVLAYAWNGFFVDRTLHGPADFVPHAVLVAVICALAALAGLRAASASKPERRPEPILCAEPGE